MIATYSGSTGVIYFQFNYTPFCVLMDWLFQFDWEGDLPLKFPQRDLVIYEMHVRGFTKHESSSTEFPGTYLGVVEKLDHLKVHISNTDLVMIVILQS